MQIMATDGAACTVGGKEVKRFWSEDGGATNTSIFDCAKPFELHFKYRHAVNDHNNLCHATSYIEESWQTNCWSILVFLHLCCIIHDQYLPCPLLLCLQDQGPQDYPQSDQILMQTFGN